MRITRLLVTVLFVSLALTGCDSGGSNDNDSGLPGGGTLSATVAGSSFTATTVTATNSSGVLAIGGNLGATSPQRQINLTVNGAAAGTYQIGIGGAIAVYSQGSSAADLVAYAALSGSVTIESFSGSGAKGTFNFSARANDGSTIQVTNGQFDVSF